MATAPTPLPVIEVANPCPADWEGMTGDDRVRFCAHCQRHVHDLSAMRSVEVLICRSAGRLCVRFERLPDGQVKTLDYQPPPRWRVRYHWLVVGILGAMGIAAGQLFWQRRETPPPRMVVGDMVPAVRLAVPPGASGPAPASAPTCATP